MPEVAFVMSADHPCAVHDLLETLRYELQRQAVPSTVHVDGFPAPTPQRVYILLDPCEYVRLEGAAALPDDGVLKRTIFISSEPAPAVKDDPHLALLDRAGAVFVLDPRTAIALDRLGLRTRVLRLGYSGLLDRFDPQAPRPIDVMFLGGHSGRRMMYLGRGARVLARFNCRLQITSPTADAADAAPADGEEIRRLLAQTKVLVNLHRGGDTRLEWRRTVAAIHCGAVLVTEHSSGMAPLVAGEHLLAASGDALPFVTEALLRDDHRLATLRTRAHERLRTWLPFALPVSILRAAVVELVGEAVPARVSLGRLRSRPDSPQRFSRREEDRAPALSHAAESPAAVTTQVLYETPAWSRREPPRVGVVTALVSDSEDVVPTLESLCRNRLRDFELVVVAGPDAPHVRTAAEEWLIAHPAVPARLAACPGSGRGAARNTGVSLVEAPLCLVLDPGQELYPRCLEVLAQTMDAASGAAFAFPIQEVTNAPEEFVNAGGDYLLSYLSWAPMRLRRGNYIHAPALIRTSELRAVGGYVTDPRLAGFEDYDLWCRLAERGEAGEFVAQTLARRPESGSSATLATINPAPGPATALLTKRAPRLLSGAFPTA